MPEAELDGLKRGRARSDNTCLPGCDQGDFLRIRGSLFEIDEERDMTSDMGSIPGGLLMEGRSDREASSYMPFLFGGMNYVMLDDVKKLPNMITEIYRRLTT